MTFLTFFTSRTKRMCNEFLWQSCVVAIQLWMTKKVWRWNFKSQSVSFWIKDCIEEETVTANSRWSVGQQTSDNISSIYAFFSSITIETHASTQLCLPGVDFYTRWISGGEPAGSCIDHSHYCALNVLTENSIRFTCAITILPIAWIHRTVQQQGIMHTSWAHISYWFVKIIMHDNIGGQMT